MKEELRYQINKALDREKASYSMYVRLINKARSYNLQAVFNALAIEELKHEALLRQCLQGGEIRAAREKINARFDDEMQIKARLNPTAETTGLREGMELAIKKEKQAGQSYDKLLNSTDDAELKYLFRFLRDEEKKHEIIIGKELSRL